MCKTTGIPCRPTATLCAKGLHSRLNPHRPSIAKHTHQQLRGCSDMQRSITRWATARGADFSRNLLQTVQQLQMLRDLPDCPQVVEGWRSPCSGLPTLKCLSCVTIKQQPPFHKYMAMNSYQFHSQLLKPCVLFESTSTIFNIIKLELPSKQHTKAQVS